tara:strand:+ start:8453 stop:9025 length:573 start_codon:yes stop_codon:yes gene_type:complete
MRIFLSISTFSISFALGPINAAEVGFQPGQEKSNKLARSLEKLKTEEQSLLNQIDSYAGLSDQLANLSRTYAAKSKRFRAFQETHIQELASCEALARTYAESRETDPELKALKQQNVEECLDRANGGNLGLAQAETAVEKLKGKVAQLKRRGEINTTNALALESSLERVRAQIRFFSASDEENSSLGQNP